MTKRPKKRGPGRPKAGDPVKVAEGVRLLLAGDPDGAVAAAGVSLRTLYRARDAAVPAKPAKPVAASPAPVASPAASSPQKLVAVPRRPAAVASPPPAPEPAIPDPPPSSPEPTADEIAAIDTEAEAQEVYRLVKGKIKDADDVRFASLSEKALGALNRIEQIRARRPQVQAPDEVVRRLVEVRGRAVERFGILAREAVTKGTTA